ncbi:hypothetical protein CXG81DRAFT_23906 [Caulochytrium protostelioides]|uniref:Uncharacterized protein n=1 Tax=Caulochytrium protostelioides TaxID=1555241 RepID=A0A4P9XDG6_9FUNG|nr:hypothetical protein CXG81DRAFT_23906 [Caulochytrium protostelioides]|eukprot:RKP03508.1 hypothetical protein CXG81DRAFT_23906 [Caulochytrium protostelioides]
MPSWTARPAARSTFAAAVAPRLRHAHSDAAPSQAAVRRPPGLMRVPAWRMGPAALAALPAAAAAPSHHAAARRSPVRFPWARSRCGMHTARAAPPAAYPLHRIVIIAASPMQVVPDEAYARTPSDGPDDATDGPHAATVTVTRRRHHRLLAGAIPSRLHLLPRRLQRSLKATLRYLVGMPDTENSHAQQQQADMQCFYENVEHHLANLTVSPLGPSLDADTKANANANPAAAASASANAMGNTTAEAEVKRSAASASHTSHVTEAAASMMDTMVNQASASLARSKTAPAAPSSAQAKSHVDDGSDDRSHPFLQMTAYHSRMPPWMNYRSIAFRQSLVAGEASAGAAGLPPEFFDRALDLIEATCQTAPVTLVDGLDEILSDMAIALSLGRGTAAAGNAWTTVRVPVTYPFIAKPPAHMLVLRAIRLMARQPSVTPARLDAWLMPYTRRSPVVAAALLDFYGHELFARDFAVPFARSLHREMQTLLPAPSQPSCLPLPAQASASASATPMPPIAPAVSLDGPPRSVGAAAGPVAAASVAPTAWPHAHDDRQRLVVDHEHLNDTVSWVLALLTQSADVWDVFLSALVRWECDPATCPPPSHVLVWNAMATLGRSRTLRLSFKNRWFCVRRLQTHFALPTYTSEEEHGRRVVPTAHLASWLWAWVHHAPAAGIVPATAASASASASASARDHMSLWDSWLPEQQYSLQEALLHVQLRHGDYRAAQQLIGVILSGPVAPSTRGWFALAEWALSAASRPTRPTGVLSHDPAAPRRPQRDVIEHTDFGEDPPQIWQMALQALLYGRHDPRRRWPAATSSPGALTADVRAARLERLFTMALRQPHTRWLEDVMMASARDGVPLSAAAEVRLAEWVAAWQAAQARHPPLPPHADARLPRSAPRGLIYPRSSAIPPAVIAHLLQVIRRQSNDAVVQRLAPLTTPSPSPSPSGSSSMALMRLLAMAAPSPPAPENAYPSPLFSQPLLASQPMLADASLAL